MIDDLLQEIHRRLDEVLSEAQKLRSALAALGDRDGSVADGHEALAGQPRRGSRTRSRRGTASASHAIAPGASPGEASARARTRSTNATHARARSGSGATRAAVLAALSGGDAMTASEVAAATGLGRASVSTTLSKLAKTSEVTKAQRGYRLAKKS
jgi:DNA-binding transcriptional ArsR family regulator